MAELEYLDDDVDNSNDIDGNIEPKPSLKVRLDKWLWAARFYKTCALARLAIETGNVMYNNAKVKAGTEVEVGAIVKICHNNVMKVVVIMSLASRRKSFSITPSLFKVLKVQEVPKITPENYYQLCYPNTMHSNVYNENSMKTKF